MIFHTKHQKDISIERYNLNVMLYQFGLFISLGLFTMVIVSLFAFGDSTTQKKSVTMPQSMHQKSVKK